MPVERIRDRTRISEMYLRGLHQAEIAHELGVSQKTISNELKILSQDFINSANVNIAERKGWMKAQIELMVRTAWDAWLRSIRQDIVTTQDGVLLNGQPTGAIKVSKKSVNEIGDPRYLEVLIKAFKLYIDMFGMAAAQQLDLTSDGAPFTVPQFIEVIKTYKKDE